MLRRLSQVGLFSSMVVLASSCGIVEDLDTLAKAQDAAIEKLQSQDKDAVEKVYSTSFLQIFDSVGKTVGKALEAAKPDGAPAYRAAASGPTEISGSVDETVDVATGGTVTLKGTYKATPNEDKTMTLVLDLTATWSALSVDITGAKVVSSGSSTLAVNLNMADGKGAKGTAAWKGTLNADGTDLPFDLTIALEGDAILMTGTINGKTYSFDAAQFGNKNEGDNQNQGQSDDASIKSITLNNGSLSPALSDGVNAYSVELDEGTSSLTLTVTANDPNAQVLITKTGNLGSLGGSTLSGLEDGKSYELTIVVTAQDGTTKRTVVVSIVVKRIGSIVYTAPITDVAMSVAYSSGAPALTNLVSPTFTISPTTLPSGLSFNTSTGVISGTIAHDWSKIALKTVYTIRASESGTTAATNFELGVKYKQHFLTNTWPDEITKGTYPENLHVSNACYVFYGSCSAYGAAYAEPMGTGYGVLMHTDLAMPIQFFFALPNGNYTFSYYNFTAMNPYGCSGTIGQSHVVVTNTAQVTTPTYGSMEAANLFDFSIGNATEKLLIENTSISSNCHQTGWDNFEIRARVAPTE